MADDELVDCPNGHRVPRDQVVVRDGKMICPACLAGGWVPPAPARWSRRSLAPALWLVFAGELLAGIGELSGLKAYASGFHFTVSNAAIGHYVWAALGHLLVAIGAAIAASVVGRHD